MEPRAGPREMWARSNQPSLAHTFRIGRDGEQLLLRSAFPSLDLYHREAAPGIPNHVPVAGTCRVSAAVGKVKWNVAPRPLFAVAHKRPPCDSTMERLIDNPMPLPWGLVVKNAVKDLPRYSRGQPDAGIADRDQQLTILAAAT